MADPQARAHTGPAIRIQGLNKWFGEFHVLTNVDLEVAKGERIVVCGPSGSGKSTLIRCINRLVEPTGGKVFLNDLELSALGADNRNDVNGFWVQEGAGQDSPIFYLDDIVLESGVPPTPPLRIDGMGIYDDALINGWQNWSWATVNLASAVPVRRGPSAVSVTAGVGGVVPCRGVSPAARSWSSS